MPLETFNRLPKRKQERFLEASLKEFSNHNFDQASITRLVQELGIAKGSVYQYFSDKFDLYSYLVNRSYAKLEEILEFVDTRGYDDLSSWYINRTIAEIKFAQEFEDDFRLIQLVKKNDKDLFNKTWKNVELNKFNTLVKKRFEDSETRSFMAYHLKEKFVTENHQSPVDQLIEKLQSISRIIFT